MKIVFLGGGRITTALLAGLRRAGVRGRLLVHDHHPRKLQELRRAFGVSVESDLHPAVAAAQLLVIAVRPGSVRELLAGIGRVDRPIVAVSLAAGLPLSRLRGRLGPSVKWARAMPSPACRTGCGLTALTFERGMSRRAKIQIRKLFQKVGTVVEIPEKKFNLFTASFSVSHGYHALAALASAARKLGLDRKTALTAAAHALAEGIFSWRASGASLENLLREAATPGGTAAATMAAMDKAGYRRAIERGLRAGTARAHSLASSK